MTRLVISIFSIVILSSCATYSTQPYQDFLATLKGLSETELISRLGVPSKTYTTKEAHFLNYYKSYSNQTGSGYMIGNNYYSYSTTYNNYCSTTFVIQDDKVVNYFFEGNDCGEYVVDEKDLNHLNNLPVF